MLVNNVQTHIFVSSTRITYKKDIWIYFGSLKTVDGLYVLSSPFLSVLKKKQPLSCALWFTHRNFPHGRLLSQICLFKRLDFDLGLLSTNRSFNPTPHLPPSIRSTLFWVGWNRDNHSREKKKTWRRTLSHCSHLSPFPSYSLLWSELLMAAVLPPTGAKTATKGLSLRPVPREITLM